MRARRHILAGAVLLATGCAYGALTAGLPARSLPDTPGPAFLPWLITAGWLVLSLALLVRGLVETRRASAEAAGYRVPARGWIALVGFVAYVVLLSRLGFVVSSVAFFAGLMWLYGERNRIVLALTSVAVPVVLFYLFTAAFQILLPQGPW